MKLIKYFLQKRSVTLLLLLLIFFGGLFAYAKMGKLEDAPFTIKQALVLTPYSGAMYIILSLLSSSNLHHNPLWT